MTLQQAVRRRPGEGSIFRASDGQWVCQISDGPRIARRYLRRKARTRPGALRLLRELQARAHIVEAPRPRVRELIRAQPPQPPAARRMTTETAYSKTVSKYTLKVARERGWQPRSAAEARVALVLHSFGLRASDALIGNGKPVFQQYKVNKYRLDFACPDVKIGIEADGPYHRLPEIAVKDLERDQALSAEGWIVFRVDPYAETDVLEGRLARIARIIHCERLA